LHLLFVGLFPIVFVGLFLTVVTRIRVSFSLFVIFPNGLEIDAFL